jgi:DNA repair protein RecO (recombination protein O)
MQAFCELSLSWTGRGELFTLTKSDVLTGNGVRAPDRVICGLYLNELILHMIPRLLPSPELYRCYAETVSLLNDTEEVELLLRRFEMSLLHSTGYGLQLEQDAEDDTAIDPKAHYYYDCLRGPIRCSSPSIAGDARDQVSGRTLIWLRSLESTDKSVMREAKQLLRKVLDYHLQDKPLLTRDIMRYVHS